MDNTAESETLCPTVLQDDSSPETSKENSRNEGLENQKKFRIQLYKIVKQSILVLLSVGTVSQSQQLV